MNFTYVIILVAVLVISPFVLKLASSQDKKNKQSLKSFFIFIILAQIILGFFGGVKLALNYPQSLLGLFFVICIVQMILLFLNQKFHTLAVILNFINTIIFFIGMIRLGQITGIQIASLASIGTAFAVLIGNVLGLILINRDKNLLKKYF